MAAPQHTEGGTGRTDRALSPDERATPGGGRQGEQQGTSPLKGCKGRGGCVSQAPRADPEGK